MSRHFKYVAHIHIKLLIFLSKSCFKTPTFVSYLAKRSRKKTAPKQRKCEKPVLYATLLKKYIFIKTVINTNEMLIANSQNLIFIYLGFFPLKND